MSGREFRPPREMDVQMRRGVRGEPSGRPIPSESELREAADRHLREGDAHREEPSIWTRFTHSLAGKLYRPR
jgi:hypothetical protein